MNKKLNTVLFIIAGTVFNIVVTVLCIVLFAIVWGKVFMPHVGESLQYLGFIIAVFGGAILGFLIYRTVFSLISKKIDIEKYFDPLFKPRRKK